MKKEIYGEDFQGHFMEQYKICVEMADRVSARRVQTSSFYVSLLSALLAILSLLIEKKLFSGSQSILVLFAAILGLILCFTWYINVQSYKQLNSLKYQVINEMEQELPFPCYAREWEILKSDQGKNKKYTRLTSIEKFIPIIFAIQYFALLIYSFLSLLRIIT